MAKLKHLGREVEKQIIAWKGEGYSSSQIANKLKEQYGVTVHPTNINRFIKQRIIFAASYAKGREEVRKYSENVIEMFQGKMLDLINEIEKQIELLKATNDSKEVINAMVKLADLLVKSKSLFETVKMTSYEHTNVIELGQKIPKILEMLEEKGYIEIKRKIPNTGVIV